MTYKIDTLAIATDGVVSSFSTSELHSSLLLATSGHYLVVLTEEIIDIVTPPIRTIGSIGGWVSPMAFGVKKKKKKITAKVIYNDKIYEESIIVEDITVKLSDVQVELVETESKPKITITVMRD